jgi:hypothetical protein
MFRLGRYRDWHCKYFKQIIRRWSSLYVELNMRMFVFSTGHCYLHPLIFSVFFFLIDGSEKFLNFPTFLPREKNNRKMGVLLLRSWNVVEPRGTWGYHIYKMWVPSPQQVLWWISSTKWRGGSTGWDEPSRARKGRIIRSNSPTSPHNVYI